MPNSLAAQRTNAKMLPGCKRDDAPAAVEDLLARCAAEADPVLDPLLDMRQFDMGEAVIGMHGAARGRRARAKPRCRSLGISFGGWEIHAPADARSMSATVTPR